MHLRKFILIILVSGIHAVNAQILDDSTSVIFGPTSTRYFTEDELYLDDPEYRILDTTLYNQHRISLIERTKFRLQNLGLEGTTIRDIFYKPPEIEGVRPGFDGFNYYVKGPRDIRYFDTRSPYSRISTVIGSNNRAHTDIQFSRSDSINFNFGFDFYAIANDRQVNRSGRGDRETEDIQYDVYAHYKTSNLKYQALVNFTRDRHVYHETGGIDTVGTGDFLDNESGNRITTAESVQLQRNVHLYHQYMITDWLEVFNINDWGTQANEYKDSSPDPNYYDRFYISDQSTADSTDFRYLSIIGGLKGRYKKFHYNVYHRWRQYEFNYKYADADTLSFDSLAGNQKGIERYYGFLASYDLPKNHKILGGMRQLSGKFNNFIEIRGPHLTARWQKILHTPSFLQQAYIGNHRFWVNNFGNVQSDKITGKLEVPFLKTFMIAPTFDYSSIRNYVYFDKDTLPAQYGGTIKVFSPGINFKIDWRDTFVLEGEWIRTNVTNDPEGIMQIPRDFVFGRFYYHDYYFKNALEAMFGVEGNYKSPYYGYAYDPVVQQFYLQDHTKVEGVKVMNLFMNFRITRATFFIKLNNLREWFTQEGYLVAPGYRGLRATFDFGFNWWFFD